MAHFQTDYIFRYNEQTRRDERHLVFDVRALILVIVRSVDKALDSMMSFSKIAEGGSYRIFEAVFDDGFAVIARLPYPCTVPRTFGIASEVATMQFLRMHGIPIPQLFDWASSASNAVGSGYIIMARAEGRELEHTWYTMTLQERMNMMEKIVDVEKKLFQIQLPANGSVYHRSFLESQRNIARVPIKSVDASEDEFCVGPSTEYLWWYGGRDTLAVNRGPCTFLPVTPDMCCTTDEDQGWTQKM